MTFFSDLTDGLAFIISPGAYLGKMNGRRKMNGNGKKKIKPVNKKK